jgi:hypothetical protein
MKPKNVLIVAVLVSFLVMVSVTAVAQEKKVKKPEVTKTKKVKQSEATETKKIVLDEAARFSPAILLGKAKELELTESQQAQLVAIMKEMQTKTMTVLTKAQAAKVKTWKSAPQMAQEKKVALPTESTEPSDAKTKIVKAPDDTKAQAKK